MCGVAGMFGRPDEVAVGRMVSAMSHRGPDDRGVFADATVCLGHARLSIIDRTQGGHQPMMSLDGGVVIAFNGEVYNFREERSRLQKNGFTFQSDSDTEVVLALYLELGDSFVERLRGIFAFALYDRRGGVGAERLLLARDHFGIKPLLYSQVNGRWVFASELKALLSSGLVPRRVDSQALQQLLSLGSVYQPATLVQDVSALPAAHMLLIDHRGAHLRRYWSYGLDRVHGLRQLPYPEQVELFASVLTDSVRRQMVADVPVGAFLSGGVDSSLIVALMAREAGGHIKTFSVGFEEGAGAADESHEAGEIARLLETDHTRVLVTSADMVAHLDKFVVGLDQPSVDGFNSYFVSHAASQGVTVSLSGTGGDELFLGYPWFANVQNSFLATYPTAGGTFVQRLVRHLPFANRQSGQRWGASSDPMAFREIFGRQYHCFGPSLARDLLSPSRRASIAFRSLAEDLAICDELPDGNLLERASVMCMNGYTRNQLLRDIDACSMAHSLEVRVPFLDVNVADFAFSLPVASKLTMSARTLDPAASYTESGVKRIVCDVARKHLPPEFFDARAKRGFALPFADCLKGPLAELLADTLSPISVINAGLFDPDAVARTYKDFLAGKLPWSHVWLLMVTELWRRKVLQPEET